MSTTTEKNFETDELAKLEMKQSVLAPDGQFEKPADKIEEGPYYASVEERVPEVAASELDVAGDVAPSAGKEFPVDRRDFMRLFSASAVLGASAACVKRPEEKVVPYVNQPVDTVPGRPTFYASTCGACPSSCGTVVRVREGRPTRIDGHPEHPLSQGGLCGLGQGSAQMLFHPERRKGPFVKNGQRLDLSAWQDVYERLGGELKSVSKVGILAGHSTGNRNKFLQEFLEKMGSSADKLYTWDPNTLYGSIAEAHQIAFGAEGLPRVELRKTDYIVGIGSDFLDMGTTRVYHQKGYSRGHSFNPSKDKLGRLVQFESNLSLTGGEAKERHVIPVGSETTIAMALLKAVLEDEACKGTASDKSIANEIIGKNQTAVNAIYTQVGLDQDGFAKLASDLLKSKSVVLAGGSANFDANSTALQLLTIYINILLGAYEPDGVLLFADGWLKAPYKPGDMKRFLSEVEDLDVLFVLESDPLHNLPASWGLAEKLKKVKTIVSVQSFPTEVDKYASYVLNNNHHLESWGDEEPVAGFWSIRQPAVRATTDSRQAEDALLWIAAFAGKNLPYQDYRSYLLKQWESLHGLSQTKFGFKTFSQALQRRGFVGKLSKRDMPELKNANESISVSAPVPGMKIVAPIDPRFMDGKGAHLPVMQEIGDPLTTITWDSWVAVSPGRAKKEGWKRNDVLKIQGPAGALEVALFPMPGLHEDAVVIHRGNGHSEGLSQVSGGVGVNPLNLISMDMDPISGEPAIAGQVVKVSATGKRYRLAAMQKHNDIANRTDVYKKVGFKTAKKNARKTRDVDNVPDIYPPLPDSKEYRWGLSVDLGKCTGCGSCMVSCAIENNVPQVGREQILLGREMHWIRLDRYFDGAVENPGVNFQPVMCQQCNHAPCEAVCPVFATTHDPEGFNQMTYNRCVGTRYCANACPYKVRRFNWFTHKWASNGKLGNKQYEKSIRPLNPDVTVRTRGVMEKCNFCVGRIKDAKHQAKLKGRPLRDNQIKVACQQNCPHDAIEFGNLKDPRSRISQMRKDNRAYLMLNGDPDHKHYGIKTLPNVSYVSKVTEKEQIDPHAGGDHHG